MDGVTDFSTRLLIKDRQRPAGRQAYSPGCYPVTLWWHRRWWAGPPWRIAMVQNKKASTDFSTRLLIKDRQRLTLPGVILVPSALVGLTSLFGMGRGDPHRYCHLKIFKMSDHLCVLGRSCGSLAILFLTCVDERIVSEDTPVLFLIRLSSVSKHISLVFVD